MEKLKSAMILTVNSIDDKNVNPKELLSQLKNYKQLVNFISDYGLKLKEHYKNCKEALDIRNEIDILRYTYLDKNEEINKSIEIKKDRIKHITKNIDCQKSEFYKTILNHMDYFKSLSNKLYEEYEKNINKKEFKLAESILLCISTLNSIISSFADEPKVFCSSVGRNAKATNFTDSITSAVNDKYKWNDSWKEFAGSVTEYIDATFEFAKNSIGK